MSHVTLLCGNALDVLPTLPAASVHCIVTSPPYWGLRDYSLEPQVWGGRAECAHVWEVLAPIHKGGASGGGEATEGRDQSARNAVKDRDAGAFCACGAWRGHLGLEPTPELYVEHIVLTFREMRRVLRPDGTLWLNMGDSYTDSGRGDDIGSTLEGTRRNQRESRRVRVRETVTTRLRPKNLLMMPARVALALQADGWWVRAEVVWSKPNPMPESVTDRPTRSHEYVYLLARSERYFYDAAAIAEPASENTHARISQASLDTQRGGAKQEQYQQGFPGKKNRDRKPVEIIQAMAHKAGLGVKAAVTAPGSGVRANSDFSAAVVGLVLERNARTVWEISTQPYPDAHFATFPEELARRCIVAGSSPRTCEKCGAPWKRQISTTYRNDTTTDGRPAEGNSRKGQGVDRASGIKVFASGVRTRRHDTTTGWRPTCLCDQAGTGRSVVLDPFGGSGTVAQVATGNGRDAIYIDLNPAYLELARHRIGPLLIAP